LNVVIGKSRTSLAMPSTLRTRSLAPLALVVLVTEYCRYMDFRFVKISHAEAFSLCSDCCHSTPKSCSTSTTLHYLRVCLLSPAILLEDSLLPYLAAAEAVKVRRVDKLDDLLAQCDVITVNCPLHEGTRGLINKENLKLVKKGAWIVNTARGAICDRIAIKEALESGQINGRSSPCV
jgi:D-isomer specific 2-hydroxyacid dehydrogenase, NAD binding domain